jgi:hypothetical protein
MRKTALVLAMLLLVSSVALSGCQAAVNSAVKSGVENATGVKTDGNGGVTINKDGKEVTINGGGASKLPSGFPSDFPMVDPLTIAAGASATSNGEQTFTVTGSTTKSFDETKTFYADKLKAAGWTVDVQGVSTGGGQIGGVTATKGNDKAGIQVAQTDPAKPVDVVVSLTIKQ